MQFSIDYVQTAIDAARFIAGMFALYLFYRWGHFAGWRDATNQTATYDAEQAREIVEKSGWIFDPETGQYRDAQGIFHAVPIRDADLIALIRAKLGIEDGSDLWAQFNLRLSTDATLIAQLQDGMGLLRSGLARAADVIPALVAEVTSLRGALNPFAEAWKNSANPTCDLAPWELMENRPGEFQTAAELLAPKEDSAEAIAMARLKELGIIGPGSAAQIYEKVVAEGRLKPAETLQGSIPVEYVTPAEVARRAANGPDVIAGQQAKGIKTPSCPKCEAISGGDWSQCYIGRVGNAMVPGADAIARCPILQSPHFDPATAEHYAKAAELESARTNPHVND
jgi:hypothetical protein